MKKFLFTISCITLFGLSALAQSTVDAKEQDFDKKFRFGLRAAPQPTWYKSNDNVSSGAGAAFGFGFGLSMEFKLSNIVHFLTGIGGDLEGGKIDYKNNANLSVKTVVDDGGNLVEAKNGVLRTAYDLKPGNTMYVLKQRTYKTTMITIPLLLKMMTQEYNAMRYFALFGGELGIRAGAKANDTYYSGVAASSSTTPTGTIAVTNPVADGQLKTNNINVNKDASLVPLRFGMNVGLGTEYRLAGSTSLVFSVNYFQSFTNLMRNDSKYLTTAQTLNGNQTSYTFAALSQALTMRSVRINIGIMF